MLWIGAGVGFLVLEAIVAVAFQPQYSYARDYISDLGVPTGGMSQDQMFDSPLAYLMNIAFYLQGTLFLAGAVLVVRAVGSRNAGLFLTLASANAVGNILVGTFHSGPIAELDGTAWVHRVGAALAIAGGNAAILAGSAILRHASASRWYRAASCGLAAFGLMSLAMVVVGSTTTAIIVLPHGVWERGSVYSIIGWQIFTAAYLLRWTERSSR